MTSIAISSVSDTQVRVLPNDDNDCGWYRALPPPPAARVLQGAQTFDRVVVGAGFTGLAAARRLAELCPNERIALVEAQRVAAGASGRNMGFVIDLPHKGELAGSDIARKRTIMRLNRAAIDDLAALVERHGIACQWSRAGKYQAAAGARGAAFLDHFELMLTQLGEPFSVLDRAASEQVLGTPHYVRSVFTPGCILMQPAALVRGLADTLPPNVVLYEDTPVTAIERQSGGFTLSTSLGTSLGTLRACQLLLCTEAFTMEFGYLRQRLLPIMTFASMTEPLTDRQMQAYGGTFDWGLTPADHGGTTVRMSADRRLLIRNTYRYAPRYHSDGDTLRHVRQAHGAALRQRFPALGAIEFAHTWGGVTCLSRDFTASFFGALEPGVFGSFCHNGVGVARGTISGRLLADLALGASSRELADMQSVSGLPPRNPPEPWLGIGVRARLKFASWTSRKEI